MNTEDIRILIVEDETELADLLRDYLLAEKYQVDVHYSGANIVEQVREQPPHLILLDLMLPEKDGISICREIRRFSEVPIIMVTARVEEIDRILGLELGADDYICKPARPREIVARVKAVLRRSLPHVATRSPHKKLLLDDLRFTAVLDGQKLDLTAVEFRLLTLLTSIEGRVYSRRQIMDAIYVDERVVSERSIDTHIKNLRKKISDVYKGESPVHSVYSVGYKWEFTE